MAVGFQVYVDESGDEGFVFNADGTGSSRWFVLAGVVIRKAQELETVKLIDRVKEDLRRTRRGPLHFRNLKHEHRLPFVQRIAEAPLQTVSILIHKPSVSDTRRFSQKYSLYRLATRLLLERVSWCCRAAQSRQDPVTARVVFSNRANMSYDELRSYVAELQKAGQAAARIDWGVIDPARVVADQHERLMGLQIADAVASSMWYGVERTAHGFVEPRYGRMLQSTVFVYRGEKLGNGLMLWPVGLDRLSAKFPELEWIKQVCQ